MKKSWVNRIYQLIAVLILFTGCGGGGSSGNPPTVYTFEVDFQRVETGLLNPFLVTATIYENNALKSGLASEIDIVLSKGTNDAISEVSEGTYQFTVTPTQTGEHEVTLSYKSTSISRTALVLDSVHADWEQPQAVSGLVNTAGYEDGVTVTPDGEYLFVQYGPLYFSAFQLFNTARASGGCEGHRLEYPSGTPNRCTHPWLDNTIGPYTGPERPGFFDGRFSGTTNLHNANSWGVGVEIAPNFAPSTMFYGFKRQADGTFSQPFYLAFNDLNDAIINPAGLSFLMHGDGTATILFFMDDPSDPDMVDFDGDGSDDAQSLHDVFTSEITLGQNNILGTFNYSGTPGTPPVRGTPFPSKLVDFGKTGINGIAGTQGNPHLYAEGGIAKSIWTDDERDTGGDEGELSVYVPTSGTFPNVTTWQKVILPSPVNEPNPSDEIQPFFTGSGLYYTHKSDTENPEIYFSNYSGTHSIADFQNGAHWGTPVKILGADTDYMTGTIIAVGEPTIATRKGQEYLYFVYAYIRDFDGTTGLPDIDMQAGYIKKK